MNPTSPVNETDALDRLFSDFFKSQLRKPWPKAPLPAAAAEPSELATARAAEMPRNAPAPARRDTSARARFTLAASVALALGATWYLSNGFQPGSRSTGPAPASKSFGILPHGTADGTDHAPLKKIEQDKAKGDNGGIKIDLNDGN